DQRNGLNIWRPFLNLSKESIQQWVTQLQIQYVHDPSNDDVHYDRNWCRSALWPILQQRFPKMQQALSRHALLMQDADEILQQVVLADLQSCGDQRQLDLRVLSKLTAARQRQLLSYWMKGELVYRPSLDLVQRLLNEVIHAKSDAQSVLYSQPYYYVRFQNILYRLSAEEYLDQKTRHIVSPLSIRLQISQHLHVASGYYQLKSMKSQSMGLSYDLLDTSLTITQRQGGESVHLWGRIGHRPLKKLIQDAHIFPWLRHQVQILSKDNVILGVFTPQGFWLAQSSYCQLDGWLPELIL
ncbi:MAG: tRNA lysidine(34) synthetase TilS, partial [Acinetobacter sp.]